MEGRRLRVLYLGNAMQKGLGGRISALHVFSPEISLMEKISTLTDFSSVGLLDGELWKKRLGQRDSSPGLEHELILWDRNPALWHRWASWRKLREYYLAKVRRNEMPDVVVVRNLQSIFHYFVKWLRRQEPRPVIVQFLGDSGGLGIEVPWLRRFRYKFKPMRMLEHVSLLEMYDAAILTSITTRKYFEPRGTPWVWHPGAYKFEYTPPPASNHSGAINFGYFGVLHDAYAIRSVVRAFLKAKVPGRLYMCGLGELAEELGNLARLHPNFQFDGFLPKESDCLDWAQQVDVLINSRLPVRGQDNSFPSKVLEYAIAGKPILTTRVGGTDAAIGDEGIYFETENFEESLIKKFQEVSAMGRTELQRRGQATRERVLRDFNAEEQARRVFTFLEGLLKPAARPPSSGRSSIRNAPVPN